MTFYLSGTKKIALHNKFSLSLLMAHHADCDDIADCTHFTTANRNEAAGMANHRELSVKRS
jgi:hypothetical protein